MTSSPDDLAADDAREFARALSARWQTRLATDLLGVHLIGSLAHGGFSRRYSDIDIGVITERGLDPAVLDTMRSEATSLSAELGPKVSVFWTDRSFGIGRFPSLDRADYLDHAVALFERERVEPPRPSLEEVRGYLADTPFSKWVRDAEAFAASGTLAPKDHKSYLRALLYPARFVASFLTGRMMSNDDAVARLCDFCPPGLDAGLSQRALDCRRAGADPDPLFPARALLPDQVAALERFVIDIVADPR